VKDKPRDPMMKHSNNLQRLKAFRVVENGVTRKPRVSFFPDRLRTLILCTLAGVCIISIPWFAGLWAITTGIWDFVFNRG